jgi:hypothetical protein
MGRGCLLGERNGALPRLSQVRLRSSSGTESLVLSGRIIAVSLSWWRKLIRRYLVAYRCRPRSLGYRLRLDVLEDRTLLSLFPAVNQPLAMALEDFTGDGQPDLIAPNGRIGIGVLLNNGEGPFPQVVMEAMVVAAVAGAGVATEVALSAKRRPRSAQASYHPLRGPAACGSKAPRKNNLSPCKPRSVKGGTP